VRNLNTGEKIDLHHVRRRECFNYIYKEFPKSTDVKNKTETKAFTNNVIIRKYLISLEAEHSNE
jgi:hypothetical protein